jgi:predicted permease
MLTESLMLAVLGGAAGALVGRVVASLIATIRLPGDLPFRFDLQFDWRVFGYIAAVALAAGFGVGVLPALRSSRADLNTVLREGGRGASDGGRRQRARSILVVAQVAVSVVLLVAASLFVRSVASAQSIDLGFDTSHVLNASIDVAQKGYSEARGRAFYEELLRRAKALPGVQDASLAYSVPLSYYSSSAYIDVEGQASAVKLARPFAQYNSVTPEYIRTLRPRLARGRFIEPGDDERGMRIAVINEYMAHRFWPDQDAIGRRFRSTDLKNEWLLVVGIVRNAQQGLFSEPSAAFYVPAAQDYKSLRALQIRTYGDPAALAPLVQREIHALDPDLPVFDVTTMDQTVQGPNGFFLIRMGAVFGGALGLLGLVLALVGVYGVVSYAASQRTQEIGVRMALGAGRGEIVQLILGRGIVLVAAGLGVGIVIALSVSRLISNLLFNVSPSDPITFVGVPLLLGVMAMAASYVPAFRATRIDPAVALRS